MVRKFSLHKKEVHIKKDKLDEVMKGKYNKYSELHEDMKIKYGIDLSYKGFFNLITNSSSWKLLYAMVMVDVLETDISTLFEIVDVDIEDKLKKSIEMKNRYSVDS